MKTYEIEIGFCGYIGATQTYVVEADSIEEAKELALQEAMDDLAVEDVTECDEEDVAEWEVDD